MPVESLKTPLGRTEEEASEVQTDTKLVVLAAKESEDAFWSIEPFVHVAAVQVRAVFWDGDLFEGLSAGSLRSSVIMLSSAFAEQPVSETISQIKELDGEVPVVVVTADSTPELEREARCAGIFYHMTLPVRRDEIEQVTLWALQAGRRS
jgi:DNA-binding NtrC family response regulator